MSGEGGGGVGRGKGTLGPAFFLRLSYYFSIWFLGLEGGVRGRRGRMRENEACEIIM